MKVFDPNWGGGRLVLANAFASQTPKAKITRTAVDTLWQDLKYIEPESDTLTPSFYWMTRVNSRP